MVNLLQNTEQGLWQYLLAVAGGIWVFFAIAKLMSEKRQPTNTVAWMLTILLLPWVGVPLYLLLGGRKLRRLASRKRMLPSGSDRISPAISPEARSAIAKTATANGANPPLGGNSVRLVHSGEDAFAILSEQISQARHTIHLTTFILGRDDTGKRIVRMLAQKARAGVQVRLLLDAVGCMFSSRGFCNPIRDSGGEVRRFMPVFPFVSPKSSANLRNHRKIAIFDGNTALIGGHNLAREYMGPSPLKKRWKDFGALLGGPCVSNLEEVFWADWSFAGQKMAPQPLRFERRDQLLMAGTSEVQIVASGPDVDGDPLYEAIIAMIQEAEKSIWVVTPYFIPDEVLLRTLMVKARAGCEVVIIVPAKSNHPITDFARRHYLRELQRAGALVRLYSSGMLHSKAMIVDDKFALVGSANFDLRSLFVNFEIGALLYSTADVRGAKQWAQSLLAFCQAGFPEKKGRITIFEETAEDLSRLLAPLL